MNKFLAFTLHSVKPLSENIILTKGFQNHKSAFKNIYFFGENKKNYNNVQIQGQRKEHLLKEFHKLNNTQTNTLQEMIKRDRQQLKTNQTNDQSQLKLDKNLKVFNYVNQKLDSIKQNYKQKTHQFEDKIVHSDTLNSINNIKTNKNTQTDQIQSNDKPVKNAQISSQGVKTVGDNVQKVIKVCQNAWHQTFPKENQKALQKFQQEQLKAQVLQSNNQNVANMTEEQLIQMQSSIPEWKRTSIQIQEDTVQQQNISSKIVEKIQEKVNETEVMKKIKQSQEYKQYTTFQSEMKQFQSDLKDHLHNSQSPIVQGSLLLLSQTSCESTVSQAIVEIRQFLPNFDLWQLEQEANMIFKQAYQVYLNGDLENLQQICSQNALSYFKVLLQKREMEKSEPKFKSLWNIEQAVFDQAAMIDKGLPMFIFSVSAQEIFCDINKQTKQVINGGDDRIMRTEYSFALTINQNPDLEYTGHTWEIIEVQPKEIVKLLV